ncbi:hypothetical protein [Microtetraspora fusca]|uniref:Lipoprotein n=1 Tax=Microtetraspora fusca TaxID=1997 RepID=A0ABW6V495_MICFU|nr:hypothetical protein [Microtetraspora fusca]
MRTLVLAATLALTLAGCEAPAFVPGAPPSFTASGTVLAAGASSSNKEGEKCEYTSRKSADIKEGLRLVLTDYAGKTVAIGSLGPGTLMLGDNPPATQRCEFRFSIPNVPGHSTFYGLKIGDRESVEFNAAKLRSGGLRIDTDV